MSAEHVVRIADRDGDVIAVRPCRLLSELVQVDMWPDDDPDSSGGYVLLDRDMVEELVAALRNAIPSTTRPPHFEVVRSDVGHRVRLVGANGEIVLWSETYANRGDAHHVTELALLAEDAPVDVDERTGGAIVTGFYGVDGQFVHDSAEVTAEQMVAVMLENLRRAYVTDPQCTSLAIALAADVAEALADPARGPLDVSPDTACRVGLWVLGTFGGLQAQGIPQGIAANGLASALLMHGGHLPREADETGP